MIPPVSEWGSLLSSWAIEQAHGALDDLFVIGKSSAIFVAVFLFVGLVTYGFFWCNEYGHEFLRKFDWMCRCIRPKFFSQYGIVLGWYFVCGGWYFGLFSNLETMATLLPQESIDVYIQLVTFLVIASVLLQWWIVFGNPGVIEPRTLHPEADRTMVSQEQIRALKNVRKGLPEDHDPSKPKPRKLQFRQEDVSGKSVSKVVATSKASESQPKKKILSEPFLRKCENFCPYCAHKFKLPMESFPKSEKVSHDHTIGRCVYEKDHFCIWLGNCIARDNYWKFFSFVNLELILAILTQWGSVYMIKASYILANVDWACESTPWISLEYASCIWRSMMFTPGIYVTGFTVFAGILFVGSLSLFHIYLIWIGETTKSLHDKSTKREMHAKSQLRAMQRRAVRKGKSKDGSIETVAVREGKVYKPVGDNAPDLTVDASGKRFLNQSGHLNKEELEFFQKQLKDGAFG